MSNDANLISWPVAYFAIQKYWLVNFPFRTDPALWSFILTGAASLLNAMLTVSYQSVRAALANPAKTLRAE